MRHDLSCGEADTGFLDAVLAACDTTRLNTIASLRAWVSDLEHVAVLWHEAWLAWLQQSLVQAPRCVG